jgi:hypothetical protein
MFTHFNRHAFAPLGLALLTAVGLVCAAPAKADDWHHDHHRDRGDWHRDHWGVFVNGGPPPAVYTPPPTYYQPPPPVVYSPPAIGLSLHFGR